ncbi:MAG: hypothetical protein DRI46_11085 [Chloroflexi bacterium]|nr:MAG: hypothetical protein DRI46_11085 [Chloroflexota bacterium]
MKETTKEVQNKMRIQLFDEGFNMISDRLVTQGIELRKGPAEVHKGAMKIECCLFSKEDIDHFKIYLDMVRGEIPLETQKKVRGRKKAPKDVEGFREFMVKVIDELTKAEELPKPKELIDRCREEGMVFTSLEFLKDMGYPILVGKLHQKYKYMARLLKKAKNPANDKYDPSLLVGFKGDKVIIYSGAEVLWQGHSGDSADSMIKVPAKAKVKFPPYLNQLERNKFRAEIQLLKDDKERKPSKFYQRWVAEIANESPDGIEFPRAKDIPNPYNH